MHKLIRIAIVSTAVAALIAIPAAAKSPGANGRIAFSRFDPARGDDFVYTTNPDGTHDQQLLANGAEQPRWSPDGTRLKVNPHDTPEGAVSARIVNPDDGTYRDLANPDPAHLAAYCISWSSDGSRFACETFGLTDPNLNGVYTIRTSDGGGLQRVTSDPAGDDFPGDYSPNGKRLVFLRASDALLALFTVKVDGNHLRQITPSSGMIINFEGGNWSPRGNEIVFSAHVPDFSNRGSIWVVHPDGSGLRRIPIDSCGGAFSDPTSVSCFGPKWSPDGRKIVFTRFAAATGQREIYTVNGDGTGLSQVTNTADIDEDSPDWGTHPIIP